MGINVMNFDTEAYLKTKEIEDGIEMLQTVSNVLILYMSCTMFYPVKQCSEQQFINKGILLVRRFV
jgi:hypothetical protein